jgi:NAD(P)-dependent dehydrogenase (short-subunit alcohol dehydrogenase family)
MTDLLPNRVAVVTGAARGIGRACAVALAQGGADVAEVDIAGRVSPILDFAPPGADDLAQTGTAVREAGRRWWAITADHRDVGALADAAAQVTQAWGGEHGTTVNAVVPGLIDTASTRHEDRYAQAMSESGGRPSGDAAEDERAAVAVLTAKTLLGSLSSHPRTSRPSSSSSPRTPRGWSAAPRSPSPVGTALMSPPSQVPRRFQVASWRAARDPLPSRGAMRSSRSRR